MKRRLRWAGLLLLLLLGLAATIDWRFVSRTISYPKNAITNSAWYKPQALVRGSSGPSLAKAARGNISASALAEVTDFAAAQNSTALIVLHQGEVVLEKYWQGASAASLSNSMSMSKSVLALLIGIAIEEGAIGSVQDSVGKYIPEWAGNRRGRLTLKDLLYMHSGLRNEDRTDTPLSDLVQLYMGSDVEKVALRVPQLAPPGQRYDYNNVNSLVLSLVLERATGESYADYLSSRLWQPLQAGDAALWLDRPGGRAKPFCCFFATAPDWARVGQLLLNQGKVGSRQVVPAEWIRQMLVASPIEPTYGLHIWLKARTADFPNVDQAASTAFIADDTFYLDGRAHQRVYVVPSAELVIVRIGEDPPAWDDAVLPNLLTRSLALRS